MFKKLWDNQATDTKIIHVWEQPVATFLAVLNIYS